MKRTLHEMHLGPRNRYFWTVERPSLGVLPRGCGAMPSRRTFCDVVDKPLIISATQLCVRSNDTVDNWITRCHLEDANGRMHLPNTPRMRKMDARSKCLWIPHRQVCHRQGTEDVSPLQRASISTGAAGIDCGAGIDSSAIDNPRLHLPNLPCMRRMDARSKSLWIHHRQVCRRQGTEDASPLQRASISTGAAMHGWRRQQCHRQPQSALARLSLDILRSLPA